MVGVWGFYVFSGLVSEDFMNCLCLDAISP